MSSPTADPAPRRPRVARFGVFSLDLERQTLHGRDGRAVRLAPQPFRVLALLVERNGELVGRDELRRALWGEDTFVDFERGLNTCIRQVREALGDSAEAPRYVETLPRLGYRFLAPVDLGARSLPPRSHDLASGHGTVATFPVTARPQADDEPAAATPPEGPARRDSSRNGVRRGWLGLATVGGLLVVAIAVIGPAGLDAPSPPPAAAASERAATPPFGTGDSQASTGDERLRPPDASALVSLERSARTRADPAAASQPAVGRTRLAVLPFRDLAGGEDGQRVAEGFTEELIACLADLDSDRLGVVARASAGALARASDPVELAARLGVGLLLEGSVRRDAAALRVSAGLVDVTSGLLLWSTTLDRPAGALWAAQEELAGAVAEALVARLGLLPGRPAASAPLAAPELAAHEAYLRGRAALATGDDAGLAAAAQQLELAVALDPGHAGAWSALAELAVMRAFAGPWAPEAAAAAVDAAAGRALALDPTEARAELARAIAFLYFRWDLPAARTAFERALQLGPGIPAIRHWYAGWHAALGRHDEALALMHDAAELDPLSLPVLTDVGWFSLFAGRAAAAERACGLAAERFPGEPSAWGCLAEVRRARGDLAGARQAVRRREAARGLTDDALGELDATTPNAALALADRRLVERYERGKGGLVSPTFAAAALLRLGDRDRALALLPVAVAARDPWALFLAVDPRFVALRDEPGFAALALARPAPAGLARAGPGLG